MPGLLLFESPLLSGDLSRHCRGRERAQGIKCRLLKNQKIIQNPGRSRERFMHTQRAPLRSKRMLTQKIVINLKCNKGTNATTVFEATSRCGL